MKVALEHSRPRGGMVLRDCSNIAKLPACVASGRYVGTLRRLAPPRLLARASVSAGGAPLGGTPAWRTPSLSPSKLLPSVLLLLECLGRPFGLGRVSCP